MTRTAIIAAMAGELEPLVRGWLYERRDGVELWRWKFARGQWVAACAGAGVNQATKAFAEVEKDGSVGLMISAGFAGALSDDFVPGKAYRASGVIDARTGERFPIEAESKGSLDWKGPWVVTSPRVADEAEKQRLAGAYGAGLVEMEAAALARLAAMRGISFRCVKGVSDGFRDQLPDFNRFIGENGQFRMAGFILYALIRPQYWPALVRMRENSREAAERMAESLLDLLDERGAIRKQNGYPDLKH
ncbi:MAG: nucleoside phosphorylase [Terracidiphilus sp.]